MIVSTLLKNYFLLLFVVFEVIELKEFVHKLLKMPLTTKVRSAVQLKHLIESLYLQI